MCVLRQRSCRSSRRMNCRTSSSSARSRRTVGNSGSAGASRWNVPTSGHNDPGSPGRPFGTMRRATRAERSARRRAPAQERPPTAPSSIAAPPRRRAPGYSSGAPVGSLLPRAPRGFREVGFHGGDVCGRSNDSRRRRERRARRCATIVRGACPSGPTSRPSRPTTPARQPERSAPAHGRDGIGLESGRERRGVRPQRCLGRARAHSRRRRPRVERRAQPSLGPEQAVPSRMTVQWSPAYELRAAVRVGDPCASQRAPPRREAVAPGTAPVTRRRTGPPEQVGASDRCSLR